MGFCKRKEKWIEFFWCCATTAGESNAKRTNQATNEERQDWHCTGCKTNETTNEAKQNFIATDETNPVGIQFSRLFVDKIVQSAAEEIEKANNKGAKKRGVEIL